MHVKIQTERNWCKTCKISSPSSSSWDLCAVPSLMRPTKCTWPLSRLASRMQPIPLCEGSRTVRIESRDASLKCCNQRGFSFCADPVGQSFQTGCKQATHPVVLGLVCNQISGDGTNSHPVSLGENSADVVFPGSAPCFTGFWPLALPLWPLCYKGG
jgi:hypothetical protein